MRTKLKDIQRDSIAIESRLSYIKSSVDDPDKISRIVSKRFVVPKMEILQSTELKRLTLSNELTEDDTSLQDSDQATEFDKEYKNQL